MSERRENDAYDTPAYATRAFLRDTFARTMRPAPKRILEPAAGKGDMLRELMLQWPDAEIEASDIAPRDNGELGIIARPFWFAHLEERRFDLIISNPPFSECLMFVLTALELLAPMGALVYLLPMAFMESRERRDFNHRCPPHHVYALSERISFTENGKTDSRACGWFVWRNTGRKHATRLTVL